VIQKVSDRIIIVDDMRDIADNIAERLNSAGFDNVEVYTDPHEAINAVRGNTRPAIVITDFNMPGITGLELLEEIDRHHPEIDGVIVTGDMSAAMASPHHFQIFDKTTNFYPEIIARTLGIIRSHIRPLLDACPAGAEKPECPLKEIRCLSSAGKAKWLAALQPADIHPLVKHHLACMSAE